MCLVPCHPCGTSNLRLWLLASGWASLAVVGCRGNKPAKKRLMRLLFISLPRKQNKSVKEKRTSDCESEVLCGREVKRFLTLIWKHLPRRISSVCIFVCKRERENTEQPYRCYGHWIRTLNVSPITITEAEQRGCVCR